MARILEIKFDLELAIFKVKGVCKNFLTIFFISSTWNYIEIPSQTFMTNKTNFYIALYVAAGLVDISTSSQVGDSTWDIQWFYV